MANVLIIFGTRPEVIKMMPLVRALKSDPTFKVRTCATAQHRQLLDQILKDFSLTPDYDLDLMTPGQDLPSLTSRCLERLQPVYDSANQDLVLVQGDTTTAFVASLAAFYRKIPVGHVEAGLRTYDKYSPFPEEMFRRMITPMATFHFAPTEKAVSNLLKENVDADSIYQVGNTSIDSLLWMSEQQRPSKVLQSIPKNRKIILMTTHRRENFGKPLEGILKGLANFAKTSPDFQIIFPIHPNPNIKTCVESSLSGHNNVSLLPPLDYHELVAVMKASHLILTDSGGIQEEAPALNKPVLVLRDSTERPEAVEAGASRLVGHDADKIFSELMSLCNAQSPKYLSMSRAINPFGDGKSALRILEILRNQFTRTLRPAA